MSWWIYHLSTRSCLTNYSPISASDRFQKTHESTTIMKRSWFFFCAPFVFRISGLLSAIIFNVVSMPMPRSNLTNFTLFIATRKPSHRQQIFNFLLYWKPSRRLSLVSRRFVFTLLLSCFLFLISMGSFTVDFAFLLFWENKFRFWQVREKLKFLISLGDTRSVKNFRYLVLKPCDRLQG